MRIIKSVQLIFILSCLLCGVFGKGGSFDIPAYAAGQLDSYLEKLANVYVVACDRIGFAARESEYHKLFQIILEVGSKEDFKKMLNDANPIVRCMGITCLAQDKKSHHLIKRLENDKTKVAFQCGCVQHEITVGDFTREILKDPDLTINRVWHVNENETSQLKN